jgi:hypothetical protein
MKTISIMMAFVIFAVLAAGCSPSPGIPAQSSVTPTINPEFLQATLFPGPITLDVLKNSEYPVQNGMKLVQLVDGKYESGSGADYISASMLNMAAFGDLNADGNGDAAVILVENYGGTGQFEYLVPVFFIAGGGASASSGFFLGDRVTVNSMSMQNGVVTLDMLVHSPNDGLCCPSQPMTQSYRFYWGAGLVMVHATSGTAENGFRNISLEAPVGESQVSKQIQIKGNVTIAPFENTLLLRIIDVNNSPIYEGPIMVSAPDMGAPGTFDTIVDISSGLPNPGAIRIEVSEVSMADGSTLVLDSVDVILK